MISSAACFDQNACNAHLNQCLKSDSDFRACKHTIKVVKDLTNSTIYRT